MFSMRIGIIAVVCMTLSAQALAWTAMPCCADDAASPQDMTQAMTLAMHPDMGDQGHEACAQQGSHPDADHAAGDCCPGAVCSGVFAAVSPDTGLEARLSQADVFMLTGTLPNAPPEQLLRPPIT